ncbi:hypothetical protein [Niabella ginsengisoli]|uniref:DUF4136 domain-containing protein n=1 Tax=Niabella ginsengisoli TaxID=522298 RepID=A0ABS9SLY8_9BACT|nr:hypothetical protein [Niabella ginsengisoli]MCH5599382.1 hypothetical protein [Niabella ginsengisoli]
MKYRRSLYAVLLLLSFSYGCVTRNSSEAKTIVTEINGDLFIRVEKKTNWFNTVEYEKLFPSKGLSKSQKDSIVKKITDSLRVKI